MNYLHKTIHADALEFFVLKSIHANPNANALRLWPHVFERRTAIMPVRETYHPCHFEPGFIG